MAEVVVCTAIVRQEAHCVVPNDIFGVLGNESYTRGHVSRSTQVSGPRLMGKRKRTAHREQWTITTLSYVGIRTLR